MRLEFALVRRDRIALPAQRKRLRASAKGESASAPVRRVASASDVDAGRNQAWLAVFVLHRTLQVALVNLGIDL